METTSVIGNSTPCAAAETTQSDLALVHACKTGDLAAFEQLVKRYDRRLLRIAQNITHNLEDAQDAVQETFLKVFRKLAQFRENSQFSTWLFRITVNESLMKVRKQRHPREVSIDEDFQGETGAVPLELATRTPDPEEHYKEAELRDLLRSALQKLPPALRVVFVLRDVEGFSSEETAEVLELTQTAVKARLWRARLQLRERLSKYFAAQGSRLRMTQ
jgi:RNA polymerase sigma-70 factor, ECF subfamily